MPNAPDLHSHSFFSINDAFGTPESMVDRAVELGWNAVCCTEHGHVMSAPRLYKAAREKGVKPILGMEAYVVADLEEKPKKGDKNYHLTTLALSKEGYHNLVAWSTHSSLRENFHRKPRITVERMAEISPYPLHHNVILSGCAGSNLCQLLLNVEDEAERTSAAVAYVESMRSLFPNFYLEFQKHEVPEFYNHSFEAYDWMSDGERIIRDRLWKIQQLTGCPFVVTNDSHLQSPDQRNAHMAVKASSWRDRDDFTKSDAQRIEEYRKDYLYYNSYMREMEEIAECVPEPQKAIDNIMAIVEEANIMLDPWEPSNFAYSIPYSGYDDTEKEIRKRSKERLDKLVEKHGNHARERFEMELDAMGDFSHYLILMSDFITTAKQQGILTNTRGSAANSILCYCLSIHDVDSIERKLTFTRFFNRARKKLPDIDIDIEESRFQDFMRFVQDHMRELEGEGQVVSICSYGKLANRSAFRLIANAKGIDKETQDEIAKLLPQMIDSGVMGEDAADDAGFDALKDEYPDLYELVVEVFDSIKSIGQHACGWLFGTKDRPIDEWIPLWLIASSNTLVTQFDMKTLEDMGLVKGDFLRLKSLSVVKKTLNAIGKDALNITDIPLDDPETFAMLNAGRTEGVFTLQGKENRRGIMEMQAENIDDIIASVAIYRPALTREHKDKTYIKRRRGLETVTYPHKFAEDILGETEGMPLFQEQAMELAFAVGMSDADVDDIYRAIKMSKGVGRGAKDAFEVIRPRFMVHALKHMNQNNAEEYWELIKGFQGYGFQRGHSTSYGEFSFRSGYLKCHHPKEFFVSLLDVYPEKYRYITAAKAEGFTLLTPTVNDSQFGFSAGDKPNEIRVGLSKIHGLGPVAVKEIVNNAPYSSFDDFRTRLDKRKVNKARVEALEEIGALDCLGIKSNVTDVNQLKRLGFILGQPKAFRGLKPRHTEPRADKNWTHLGRTKEADITEPGKISVSKMFWIPPLEESELLELKSTAYNNYKTWLLLAVDENGIPFHITAGQDKTAKVTMLHLLAEAAPCVVCLDGAIKQPFSNDGPTGFRFDNVTGGRKNDPQVFDASDTIMKQIKRQYAWR